MNEYNSTGTYMQNDPYAAMTAQAQMQSANESQVTNQLLDQMIQNQEKEIKILKSIRSYGAVVALVAGIQLIVWILSFFGIIKWFAI